MDVQEAIAPCYARGQFSQSQVTICRIVVLSHMRTLVVQHHPDLGLGSIRQSELLEVISRSPVSFPLYFYINSPPWLRDTPSPFSAQRRGPNGWGRSRGHQRSEDKGGETFPCPGMADPLFRQLARAKPPFFVLKSGIPPLEMSALRTAGGERREKWSKEGRTRTGR